MPSLRLPILALLSLLAPTALHAASPVYRNAVLADNPVAYWELDESSGTTAADSAPPAQNGTFQNVTLAQPSAFPALGTSVRFNGSSSRVRVPANAAFQLGTGNFSVEAWARTPVASRGDIFNYKNANDFGLFLNNNGTGSISGWHNGQLPVFTTTLDAWHHIVATRSNGVLRLYVNGIERGSQANTHSFSANADLFLGANHTGAPAYSGTLWLNGWIDEVAIYASALTPARILAHYNAAQPPPTPATISILPVSSLTSSSATISARVTDPGSAIPDITFFWGDNDAGSTGPWDHEVSAGPSSGTVSLSLSALSQGTTYFYRARAVNPSGPAWSESLSFTTPIPSPPTILTLPATSIAGRSAVLNASVTSTGNDPPAVTLYFGPTDGGTNPSAWASAFQLGSTSSSPSRPVSPLAPLTTYFYRAAATNAAGTSWSPASISFSTTAWSPPSIVINEIHCNDDDPSGHYEFIELHNPTDSPADLAGAFFADGTYSALIPDTVQQHRRLIRYRISATDSTNSSIRTPYTDDPQQNFAYFVYDRLPAWSGAARPGTTTPVTYQPALLESVPPFHLITSISDHAAAQSIPVTNPNGSTSPAGAPYTHSLYNWKGALCHRGIVYDHIRYRARGGVWRFAMGKNMWKFDFNRGHDFAAYDNYGQPYSQKWRKLNFSSCIQQGDFLHRGEQGLFESVGFRLFQLSGIPAAHTNFAHFRIIERPSESNNSASQFDDDFQGLYLAVEQPDGQFLDEHNLPDGNLYKMENGTGELNNKGAGQPDNKSDLVAFQAFTPSESWWRANCNLPAYFNYRAIVDCIHHYDIGDGKNYCFYRNPLTSRWQPVPWDLDLTWADNMYRADSGIAGLAPSSNSTEPFFAPIFGNGSSSGIPAIRSELRNRTREILDLLWNQEQTGLLIDEMASVIYQPNQPSFVDADRALWDYNPILVSSAVNPSKAGHGRFYQRSADSPDGIANSAAGSPAGSFSGMITTLKNYINTRRSVITSQILTTTEENLVPATPVISRSIPGTNPIPVNALAFSSSAFSGRNGAAFAAIQWRIAPITDPAAPDFNRFNRQTPRLYEIDAAWLSPELPDFSPSITIPASAVRPGTVCRARVRHKDANGRWSHWSSPAQFTTAPPDISPYLNSLVVSQVMYHPPDPSSTEALVSTDPEDFEWIEILNVGPITLDLSAVRFTKGIDFDFATSAAPTLAPSQRAIVVRNPAAFAARYPTLPPNAIVAGTWEQGNNLSNAGESIRLSFGTGTAIREFTYDDNSPWPAEADGNGFPLVLIAPSSLPDHSLPSSWRSGSSTNGNPGSSDSRNLSAYLLSFSLSDPAADPDSDGFSTLAEYALGSHPLLPDSSPRITPSQAILDVGRGPEPFFTLAISVPHATDDITISAESSSDLVSWLPDAVLLERSRLPDGSLFLGWRSANPITSPANRWFRLRITPR